MKYHLRDGLWRVSTSYLCAGFTVRGGVIIRCAPILRKKLDYWVLLAEHIGD